jgi:hypothetical protein
LSSALIMILFWELPAPMTTQAHRNASGNWPDHGRFTPDRTLKLVFFVLEEPPIFGTKNMGSRIFARRAREKNMDIRAMISLEMVGYFSERKGKQGFPLPLMSLFYSNTPDFIAVVGNLKSKALVKQVKNGLKTGCSVPVETLTAPSIVPGVSLSDHASFWKEGLPGYHDNR